MSYIIQPRVSCHCNYVDEYVINNGRPRYGEEIVVYDTGSDRHKRRKRRKQRREYFTEIITQPYYDQEIVVVEEDIPPRNRHRYSASNQDFYVLDGGYYADENSYVAERRIKGGDRKYNQEQQSRHTRVSRQWNLPKPPIDNGGAYEVEFSDEETDRVISIIGQHPIKPKRTEEEEVKWEVIADYPERVTKRFDDDEKEIYDHTYKGYNKERSRTYYSDDVFDHKASEATERSPAMTKNNVVSDHQTMTKNNVVSDRHAMTKSDAKSDRYKVYDSSAANTRQQYTYSGDGDYTSNQKKVSFTSYSKSYEFQDDFIDNADTSVRRAQESKSLLSSSNDNSAQIFKDYSDDRTHQNQETIQTQQRSPKTSTSQEDTIKSSYGNKDNNHYSTDDYASSSRRQYDGRSSGLQQFTKTSNKKVKEKKIVARRYHNREVEKWKKSQQKVQSKGGQESSRNQTEIKEWMNDTRNTRTSTNGMAIPAERLTAIKRASPTVVEESDIEEPEEHVALEATQTGHLDIERDDLWNRFFKDSDDKNDGKQQKQKSTSSNSNNNKDRFSSYKQVLEDKKENLEKMITDCVNDFKGKQKHPEKPPSF